MEYIVLSITIVLNLQQVISHEEYSNSRLSVPTTIPVGLFTAASDIISNVSLIRGSCRQYVPHKDDRCKFYGDCCVMAPTRYLERLPDKTFSCHNGYYVIDGCPSGSDPEIKSACEKWNEESGGL